MVTVNADQAIAKIKKNFSHLKEAEVRKGIVSAINRTLYKGRTVARKEVKEVYNIPQKNLDGIKLKNASRSLLIGHISASAKPIPMDAFAPKFETKAGSISITKRGVQKEKQFTKVKKKAAQGVSVEVVKGRRESVPYAFMIRGAKPRVFARGQYKTGGSWGFVQRNKRINKTGSDTPIKPLISVTVHGAVINDRAMGKIATEVEAFFPNRLVHELERLAAKMQG